MVRQCSFMDDEGNTLGGIYCDFDNGDRYIICGCCGGIFDPNEVENLEIFNFWVDLSEEIIGD